jgi:hypothetical protein
MTWIGWVMIVLGALLVVLLAVGYGWGRGRK